MQTKWQCLVIKPQSIKKRSSSKRCFLKCIFFSKIVAKSSVSTIRDGRSFSSGLLRLTHRLCMVAIVPVIQRQRRKLIEVVLRNIQQKFRRAFPCLFFSRLHGVRCLMNSLVQLMLEYTSVVMEPEYKKHQLNGTR